MAEDGPDTAQGVAAACGLSKSAAWDVLSESVHFERVCIIRTRKGHAMVWRLKR